MIARSVVPRALVQCPLSSEPQQPYEDDIQPTGLHVVVSTKMSVESGTTLATSTFSLDS